MRPSPALVVYHLVGTALGHQHPHSPVFGVAPCPTTIFTFGLLLWTRSAIPKYLLIVPTAWALIGAWAAVALGVGEDAGLLIASVTSSALLVWRDLHPVKLAGGERTSPA